MDKFAEVQRRMIGGLESETSDKTLSVVCLGEAASKDRKIRHFDSGSCNALPC